jgi:nucleoid DNA-binding protein
MTKSQLVRLLYYKNSILNQKIISKIVDLILNEISIGVLEQKQVEIRGFGKFSNRERKAKILRHPSTKKLIKVTSYNTMHYSYSAKALEKT